MNNKERIPELLKDLENALMNGSSEKEPIGINAFNCTVALIEHALGFKLYREQIEYIFHNGPYSYSSSRQTGKTTAHCIKLALSEGEPLNGDRPDKWCDLDYGQRGLISYSRWYFRYFMNIRNRLRSVRLKVRPVKYKGKLITD